MENIRGIIASNIVALRKHNNMTQLELSKKINYSDKAISRWEKGEVVPDVETLQNLSEVFGVKLAYFFEEHDKIVITDTRFFKRDLALHLLACCALWVVITILFVYVSLFYDYTFWQVFIWGVPATIIFTLRFYRRKSNKIVKMVLQTLLNWTLLASIYLQLLQYNLWLIFIIGIPIQAYILVSYFSPENTKLFSLKSKKDE